MTRRSSSLVALLLGLLEVTLEAALATGRQRGGDRDELLGLEVDLRLAVGRLVEAHVRGSSGPASAARSCAWPSSGRGRRPTLHRQACSSNRRSRGLCGRGLASGVRAPTKRPIYGSTPEKAADYCRPSWSRTRASRSAGSSRIWKAASNGSHWTSPIIGPGVSRCTGSLGVPACHA